MERRGFATVELLQVIAIIAILVGISLPAVAVVRRRAQHASCAERLHQLGVGLTLYANDHDGWVPPRTTAEDLYSHVPGGPVVELRASPELLVKEMSGYVRSREVWFCPADPERGQDVKWLGQRHRWTSYYFYPQMPGDRMPWPPRMQLGRERSTAAPVGSEDVPLLCDAAGIPSRDSDPQFRDDSGRAQSCHPDDLVNAVRHDLSLTRRTAREWLGTER